MKEIFHVVFFSEVNFLRAFLSNPFDNFYRTLQNTHFPETILYNQKKLLGKLFLVFSYWHSVLLVITMLFKTLFRKNTFFKFFLQVFLISSSCVCTPIDESYQTNQNLSRKTNSSENMLSSKIFFLFYHQFSVLPLIKMSFKKIHEKWSSLKLIFLN